MAQLRVYNGYNCNFTLDLPSYNETNIAIEPLSAYERLDIKAEEFLDLPYSLQGQGSECADVNFNGTFLLREETANSFFVNREGIYDFKDNNDKAIDSVRVR